jgi:hypothetical protein
MRATFVSVALRREALLGRAAEAKRASSRVAFADTSGDQLVVDIAALANSGGGVVVVGPDVTVDLDQISRRLSGFDAFDVEEVERDGKPVKAIIVGAADEAPLLVDEQAYFRHGSKSRLATADDLRKFLERRLDLIRRQWLKSIREVLTSRDGAKVAVVQTEEADEHGVPTLIRLSDDPNAPLYGRLDPDRTHPYRQTEVVAEINRRLPEGVAVTPYDVLSVRRVYDVTEATRPEFTHVPKFGSPQYSDAFVDWLLEQQEQDPGFFEKAKARYTKALRARRAGRAGG